VRRLLRRCLQKEADDRLHHIADARLELREALAAGPDETEEPAAAPASTAARTLPWLLAAALAVVAVVGWLGDGRGGGTTAPTASVRPTHLQLALDSGDQMSAWPGPPFDVSPDGIRIAYVAGPNQRIHLSDLAEFETVALTGTEGARTPFFSPDGHWLGFFSGSKLRKVSVGGGVAIDLDDASASRGGSWGHDGFIYYAPNTVNPIMRIAEAGGTPEPVTELGDDPGERSHRWPQALPDGRGVLFTAQFLGTRFDDSNLEVVDPQTRERTVVHRGGTFGRYVPSGHLVFGRDSSLHVAGFDLERLSVTTEPLLLTADVPSSSEDGGAKFAFSRTGVFLGYSGGLQTGKSRIVWLERDGRETEILRDFDFWGGPVISPDGQRLLLLGPSPGGGGTDLYVVDLDKQTPNRLTFRDHEEYSAFWSPDGKRIAFTSEVEGDATLQLIQADGSGSPEVLLDEEVELASCSWTRDGRYIVYQRLDKDSAWDLWALPVQGDAESFPLADGNASERTGVVSPDGRWLAYASDESGRPEIYVQGFPRRQGRQQVSSNGGAEPHWSADGSMLYYVSGDGIYSVPITAGGERFRFGRSEKVLDVRVNDPYELGAYDVTEDGRRFLVARSLTDTGAAEKTDRVLLILDWFDELRSRVEQ
jgi:serine/threonine-protein kinase